MDKKEKIVKKKKQIIEALKRCLERDVYSQVSLEDVAREAGLSKGGLRHYYPTREELYIDLIETFFNQIQHDHIEVIQGIDLDRDDRAFLSTLFGIERFLMDKSNIKIFINIILFGFEEEKIMDRIQSFVRDHLNRYMSIIRDVQPEGGEFDNTDIQFHARISQIILLFAGIIESIDPINMEASRLVEYVLKGYTK